MTPPELKILDPWNNSLFRWGSLVTYNIEVADPEDGMSQFNEIDPNDDFMKITFITDSTHLIYTLALEKTAPEPGRSAQAKVGQCFTCHAKKNRMIGPSGFKGKEETQKIPPAELVDSPQAAEIVHWILQVGVDKKVDFLQGLSGAIETVGRPKDNTGKAVYLLTAMYTDRGGGNPAEQSRQGKLRSCCGIWSKIRSVKKESFGR